MTCIFEQIYFTPLFSLTTITHTHTHTYSTRLSLSFNQIQLQTKQTSLFPNLCQLNLTPIPHYLISSFSHLIISPKDLTLARTHIFKANHQENFLFHSFFLYFLIFENKFFLLYSLLTFFSKHFLRTNMNVIFFLVEKINENFILP